MTDVDTDAGSILWSSQSQGWAAWQVPGGQLLGAQGQSPGSAPFLLCELQLITHHSGLQSL